MIRISDFKKRHKIRTSSIFMEVILKELAGLWSCLYPKTIKITLLGMSLCSFIFFLGFKWLEFRGGCVKLKSTFVYNIYIFYFGRICHSLSKLVTSSSLLRAVDKKLGLLIKKSSWLFAGMKKGFTFAIRSCRLESFIYFRHRKIEFQRVNRNEFPNRLWVN